MTRLLTLTMLAVALFLAQPAQAQQQDKKTDSMSMHNMEMMQDSTMMKNMMQKMMDNPQMRQMMMRMMMQNMQGDTAMSGMMGGMCMNMMHGNMMEGGMDRDMNHMKKNKDDSTKMKKNQG